MTAAPRGFTLGVVMLATRFPRRRGDIGNPGTWPFPVIYRRVPAATVATVVREGDPDPQVVGAVVEGARSLEREGASLIATSCGFLGSVHERLQQALSVPLVSSSLMLLPLLRSVYGRKRPVGVLTFDARRLGRAHFGRWGDEGAVIEGVESGRELHRVIGGDLPEMDSERAARDAVEAAQRLIARAPETRALLFECTNLSPYREQVAAAVGRPVYDINRAILWHAEAMGAFAES